MLITIGVTTFDGAGEGTLAEPIRTVEGWFGDIGLGPVAALRVSNTIFLALSLGFVAGLFWAGIYGMHTVRTKFSTRELGRLFAHAFIPIALAYLVAHYFSLVVFQEQAQFTLPALGPARRRLGPLRHRRQRDRLRGDQRQRDLVRAGRRRWSSGT